MRLSRDDFPTFRRLATASTGSMHRILRWAVRRETRIRLARRTLVLAALALTGFLAARLSTSACREAVVRHVEASDPYHAPHTWFPESDIASVPLPESYRPGTYPSGPAPGSLEALLVPDRVWLSAVPPGPSNRPAEAWALARVRAVGPFLVQADYSYGYSAPRETLPCGDVLRAGQQIFGTTLFVGAFGFVFPLHHWSAGSTFN